MKKPSHPHSFLTSALFIGCAHDGTPYLGTTQRIGTNDSSAADTTDRSDSAESFCH